MTQHRIEWIQVTRMASGMDLRIAAHVLEGSRPGPTVGITASIHGDELPGTEVCRRVVEAAKQMEIAGRLVVIPVCNPPAFEAFTRNTPTDMLNLNRVFPGTADSWLSELIARSLVEYLEPRLEALLDLHAGGSAPTVDYVYINTDEELSRAFLFPTMYRASGTGPSYSGTLTGVFKHRPVAVAEIGGGGQLDPVYLRRGFEGVMNGLRHLGVVPGLKTPAPEQVVLNKMAIVRPRYGGVLHPEVTAERLGEVVPGGTLLGRVLDSQTFELLEEFRAPFEQTRLVLVRNTLTKVHAGDYAYMLGDMSSAEVLPAQ
ncbi:MAG: succinylglutamate desuccinylase/aspartoacylase family protein [Meiothermus sp.]|nr:succinylglutamate desuccinylase/aspartoacylase family protein [Meiothermus sp.]